MTKKNMQFDIIRFKGNAILHITPAKVKIYIEGTNRDHISSDDDTAFFKTNGRSLLSIMNWQLQHFFIVDYCSTDMLSGSPLQ